jgi:hypothetical protein
MAQAPVDYFTPLLTQLKARSGDMVFIRMPSSGLYLEQDIFNNYKEDLWLPMITGFDAPALNSIDFPELSTELEISQWSHLTRKSQDDWSKRVYPYIQQAYFNSRNTDINTV